MNDHAISPQAQNLLNLSKTLNHYQDLLDRHTGEQFNIFRVIGSCEATHSDILADLLSPEGTHGQGDVFEKIYGDDFVKDVEKELKELIAIAHEFVSTRPAQPAVSSPAT
ncbi:MAG: PD-(D/E)XK nuclease family protein [Limisphaerales bacterium]